jgi:hypothetical protein
MTKYQVYGDYALASECLLEEFDTYKAAERFVDGYVAQGDTGGYETIEVIEFAKDGEAITHYIIGRSDFEAFGGADDFYEGDDDFALIDEF